VRDGARSEAEDKPVFVGGGRRGDGIVIAANYRAKAYGIITAWRVRGQT